jgi:putative intracellular protease/amidase
VVSPAGKKVKGWNQKQWDNEVPVDVPLNWASAEEFDALLPPGGVMNPDQLRMDPRAVEFVKHFEEARKPLAAVCHGPWTLVEAGAVRGRTLTSWPSSRAILSALCGSVPARPQVTFGTLAAETGFAIGPSILWTIVTLMGGLGSAELGEQNWERTRDRTASAVLHPEAAAL